MLEFYWICLIIGVVFALLTILLGELMDHVIDGLLDFLHLDVGHALRPLVLIGGLAGFGGAGIVLTQVLLLAQMMVLGFSLVIGFLLAVLMYFIFVKPMQKAESTTGFSIRDLIGRSGEVITSIPAMGCGEVLVKVGAGHTNQIAESAGRSAIAEGARIVVVDVGEGGVLYVAPEEENESIKEEKV
ncbi:protease [Aneurinibacillus sp. BA2021]|nr:protease [Aneurinibacillus sp. BA2021]